jgi:adenylate kinase
MGQGARVIVLGRQGAGKGTQCARLARRLGIPHVSTGDLFRAEVAVGSSVGQRAASYLERGALVPDDLVLDLVAARLGGPEGRTGGYLLDGFPRTLAQGQALFEVLGKAAADLAVELHVPNEVVLPRLAARRVCSGCGASGTAAPGAPEDQRCGSCGGVLERRGDDTDEAIATRLALYDEQTGPLLVWLDSIGLLTTVDGTGAPDAVAERMLTAVSVLDPARSGAELRSAGLADAG